MRRLIVGLLLVVFGGATAKAGVVLDDHFNDGALSPQWAVGFTGATGWSYSESGTSLRVTGIAVPAITQDDWGYVTLTRPLSSAAGDFHADFNISWTTGSAALQQVRIALRDANSHLIAEAGYVDDILAVNGYADVKIGSGGWGSYAPVHWGVTENINFSIDRVGDLVQVSVFNPTDGTDHLLRTGTSDLPLETAEISFWRGTSHLSPLAAFYTEDVDLIRISGENYVPEPASLLVWSVVGGLGAAGAWWRRKRKAA